MGVRMLAAPSQPWDMYKGTLCIPPKILRQLSCLYKPETTAPLGLPHRWGHCIWPWVSFPALYLDTRSQVWLSHKFPISALERIAVCAVISRWQWWAPNWLLLLPLLWVLFIFSLSSTCLLFLILPCSTEDQTWGLMHIRQAHKKLPPSYSLVSSSLLKRLFYNVLVLVALSSCKSEMTSGLGWAAGYPFPTILLTGCWVRQSCSSHS